MKRTSPYFAAMALAALLLLGGSPAAPAATYYVSPSGNNNNPGTLTQPWASPGYGSRQLHPGDTLIILGGKYILKVYDDDIIIPPCGAATAWTTIKGEAGKRPVLAGRDDLFAAINLSGLHYVRVENLEITHDAAATGMQLWFRGGIEITTTPASHIVLQDLYIHHIDEGALNLQDVDDLKVINCRFEYCGIGAILGPAAGPGGGVRNLLVKGCRLSYSGHYYRGGPGPSYYDRPDGFGLEPSNGPVEIVDTIAAHNYGDGLDSKVANTYIHNCIVANNTCDGIKLWANNSKIENCLIYGMADGVSGSWPWAGIVIGTTQADAHFEVVNVTLHDNPTRQAYPIYVQYDGGAPITLALRNTIIANGSGPAFFGSTVTLTARNNLFYRPGEEIQVEYRGKGYTAADLEKGLLGPGNISRPPRFVRPAWGATGDYHLVAGSPGIDQGAAAGAPAVDLEYRPRPLGPAYDMGAYEFAPGTAAPAVLAPLLLD